VTVRIHDSGARHGVEHASLTLQLLMFAADTPLLYNLLCRTWTGT
jgi:hypothetical protein